MSSWHRADMSYAHQSLCETKGAVLQASVMFMSTYRAEDNDGIVMVECLPSDNSF